MSLCLHHDSMPFLPWGLLRSVTALLSILGPVSASINSSNRRSDTCRRTLNKVCRALSFPEVSGLALVYLFSRSKHMTGYLCLFISGSFQELLVLRNDIQRPCVQTVFTRNEGRPQWTEPPCRWFGSSQE